MDTLNVEIVNKITSDLDPIIAKNLWLLALIIIAIITAIVVPYILYARRKGKVALEAVNNIELITSRTDIYENDTEFLIISPEAESIVLKILNEKEELVEIIFENTINDGEQKVAFLSKKYPSGIYYLSLDSKSTKILRKISIS